MKFPQEQAIADGDGTGELLGFGEIDGRGEVDAPGEGEKEGLGVVEEFGDTEGEGKTAATEKEFPILEALAVNNPKIFLFEIKIKFVTKTANIK